MATTTGAAITRAMARQPRFMRRPPRPSSQTSRPKAVFTLATRLCFGDIVDDGQRHAIGRLIRDSIVAAADIGRDAKRWTHPDKFWPERFLAGGEAEDIGPAPGPKEIRMMPFGAGHRHCPGVNMGMLHIKCFLAALVHNFDWALSAEDCNSGVDMTEQDGFIEIMKQPLSARVTGRT
uniref:Cytochrome P450 89A2 n=1 Tax=Aegilops tauschii TaxID=37682 RepID=M8BTH9_AEGTA